MIKVNASAIIPFIRHQVGCGYVYGAVNQVCSIQMLKEKQAQYGQDMGNGYYQLDGDYTRGKCAKWIGKLCFDCSGLIKFARRTLGGGWADVSAQGTFDQCVGQRGSIKSMQLIPGSLVFMYSESKQRMSHVGMYIGNGIVVEARGVAYGVVTTQISDRAWTHWGIPSWMETDLPNESHPLGTVTTGTQDDSGDLTSPKPDDPLNGSTDTLYDQTVRDLSLKTGISAEYWIPRKDIDSCFGLLLMKLNKFIN